MGSENIEIPDVNSIEEARYFLDRFCDGRGCSGCPLYEPVDICVGEYFEATNDDGTYKLSDAMVFSAFDRVYGVNLNDVIYEDEVAELDFAGIL